jgi:two-component system OmpR family sensor kinase
MLRERAARARRVGASMLAAMPLRLRLMALIFALVVVALGGVGALISISEENTLLTTQAVALRKESRLAAQALRRQKITAAAAGATLSTETEQPPASLIAPLRVVADRLTNADTGVVIWNASGQMLDTSAQVEALPSQEIPSLVVPSSEALRQAALVAPADDAYSIVRDARGKNQLVVLLPLVDTSTNATVAVLQVSTPMQPITDAVSRTQTIVLVSLLAALVIAGALTAPLVSAGLRPLAAMERTSRRIAGGDLSLRLSEPPTNDELGQLSRSFNSMVQQLETTFNRQRQLVADVSHELRTPLTALNGELEMLLLGADGGNVEGVRRLARSMHAEIGRMRRLVEDLLTLAQFDEGQAALSLQPITVAPLVELVAQHARALAHGQRIETEAPGELPRILADPDRLEQALLNVLDNALKYTPGDGVIRIVARASNPGATRTLLLEVSDTGAGAPPEALGRLFDRFYRADAARTRGANRPTGAGLGLSIVKSLIEAQGGEVMIASKQGRGTTVTFTFPAVEAQAEPPQPHLPAPQHAGAGGG